MRSQAVRFVLISLHAPPTLPHPRRSQDEEPGSEGRLNFFATLSRLLLAPQSCYWLFQAAPGSSWLILAPPGFLCFLRLLQSPPGSSWLVPAPPGCARLPLDPIIPSCVSSYEQTVLKLV